MLRNREVRQFAIWFAAIAAAAIILGFEINTVAGILAITSAAAFGTAFFVFTKGRYKSIARISEQIDLVLHNADYLYIGESDEGELSILHSEVTKMLLRIREQNDVLKKEKTHLADSLADIAHQLRTPLTSVNLILSLLENNPDEKQRKALIRETKELFAQMDWLLASLLKLSRLDAGIVVFQSEWIEVNILIDSALHPFIISVDLHDIDVQIDVPKGIIIQGIPVGFRKQFKTSSKTAWKAQARAGRLRLPVRTTRCLQRFLSTTAARALKKKIYPACLTDFIVEKIQVRQDTGSDLLSAR